MGLKIVSKPNTKAYQDNYDRIFKKSRKIAGKILHKQEVEPISCPHEFDNEDHMCKNCGELFSNIVIT